MEAEITKLDNDLGEIKKITAGKKKNFLAKKAKSRGVARKNAPKLHISSTV